MNEPNEQLATYLHIVCHWIVAQDRKCLLDTYPNIFRYVAFCHKTGKMSVSMKDGQPRAIIFHQPDFIERIEAKAENGHQQFEYLPAHPGDAMFIGSVIGSREAIADIYNALVDRTPLMAAVPKYTCRNGKLVRLSARTIERFLRLKKGVSA